MKANIKRTINSATIMLVLAWLCSPATSHADPVIVWGYNAYVFTNVLKGVTNVIALAAGDQHYLALKADGTVATWGANSKGQTNAPAGLTNVVSIAAGSAHSLALRGDGTLALWGQILPTGVETVPNDATNIVGLALGAGAQHALVVRSDGTVLDWGAPDSYGLTNIPAMARNVVEVAAGSYHCLALRADGQVVAWGSGTPVPDAATNIVAVAAGGSGSAALRADGTVLTWGNVNSPTSDFTNVVDIACPFGAWILAARADGTLAVNPGTVPTVATNVAAVSAGYFDAMALIGSGTPVFPGMPVNRTVAVGSTAYLRMNAVGTLPLFYQWNCNGTNIPGATSPVLVLTNVQPVQAGSHYSLTASNAFGVATNGPIILKEIPLESFLQPPNLSTAVGATATFIVTNIIGQGPFVYQWQCNNINIDGATNSSLSLVNIQRNQGGAYAVVVGNIYGTVTNNAILAVHPFVFSKEPMNLLMTPDGMRLQLDSVYATNLLVLFASTNLMSWQPIFTNPAATGSVLFLDPEATNLQQRFYRATER